MRFLTVLTAALLALPAVSFAGDYTEKDIRENIIGRTIYLAVPLGGEFPLNYRTSGVVDGSGEALGLGKFTQPKDTGKWWIEANRLCQKFNTWYDGEPMCFELSENNGQIKWVRNNGETGTARIGSAL